MGEQTARMIVQPVECVFTRTVGEGGEETVRASTLQLLLQELKYVGSYYT